MPHRPSSALAAAALAALCLPAASLAQSVELANLRGIQPGWVRATVVYDAAFTPSFRLVPTCDLGTDPQSVKSTTAVVLDVQRTAFVDLRVDLPWLADNGLPVPCRVTALELQLLDGASVAATDAKAVAFPMDLPLSHLRRGTSRSARRSPPSRSSARPMRRAGRPTHRGSSPSGAAAPWASPSSRWRSCRRAAPSVCAA
jgi:hypothetical protein